MVDALGHEYDSVVVEPTCTEKGYTIHTCSRCGDNYKDSYVNAKGHSYGEWQVEEEPSCTVMGSKYHICDKCDDKEYDTIPAKGHQYTDVVVDPTCTEQGYTIHTCSVCQHTKKDSYVDANGHSYDDWIIDKEATILSEGSKHRVCSVCQHEETQVIDKVTVNIDTNTNYGLAINLAIK